MHWNHSIDDTYSVLVSQTTFNIVLATATLHISSLVLLGSLTIFVGKLLMVLVKFAENDSLFINSYCFFFVILSSDVLFI